MDTTLCGLEHGFDFCDHGYVPEACDEGCGEDDELVEPMTYRQALAERDEMR